LKSPPFHLLLTSHLAFWCWLTKTFVNQKLASVHTSKPLKVLQFLP
jgi:hypothetical protein